MAAHERVPAILAHCACQRAAPPVTMWRVEVFLAHYEVEFRIHADNSWCIDTQGEMERYAEYFGGEGLPVATVDIGRGGGVLVLTWPSVKARGGWRAIEVVAFGLRGILPEVDQAAQCEIRATMQPPLLPPPP